MKKKAQTNLFKKQNYIKTKNNVTMQCNRLFNRLTANKNEKTDSAYVKYVLWQLLMMIRMKRILLDAMLCSKIKRNTSML